MNKEHRMSNNEDNSFFVLSSAFRVRCSLFDIQIRHLACFYCLQDEDSQ
jgi:hypothetical protein